jgi:hypothetical protein
MTCLLQQPRKSILKSNSASSLNNENEDLATNQPLQVDTYRNTDHTISFPLSRVTMDDTISANKFADMRDRRQSLGRKVSFAGHAHVR